MLHRAITEYRATFETCGSNASFGSAVDERTSYINIGVVLYWWIV